MVKGIGRGLGFDENDISSPTFAIVAEHRRNCVVLFHFDVYRLFSETDLDSIGFEDYVADKDAVIVVEWADRILNALPDDRLLVTIEADASGEKRIIRVEAKGDRSSWLLEKLSTRLATYPA
jgi:tRNA threonylcarbamoyladenosine biosynthesis protein TsaE